MTHPSRRRRHGDLRKLRGGVAERSGNKQVDHDPERLVPVHGQRRSMPPNNPTFRKAKTQHLFVRHAGKRKATRTHDTKACLVGLSVERRDVEIGFG